MLTETTKLYDAQLFRSAEQVALFAVSLCENTVKQQSNIKNLAQNLLPDFYELAGDSVYKQRELKRALHYYHLAVTAKAPVGLKLKSNVVKSTTLSMSSWIRNAKDATLVFKIAQLHAELDDLNSAIQELTSIPTDFRDLLILQTLGKYYLKQNKKPAALAVYLQAFALSPFAIEIIEELIILKVEEKELHRLTRDYLSMQYSDNTTSSSQESNQIVWIESIISILSYKLKFDHDKALPLLQSLQLLFPNNLYLLQWFAEVYYHCEIYDECLWAYEQVTSLDRYYLYNLDLYAILLTSLLTATTIIHNYQLTNTNTTNDSSNESNSNTNSPSLLLGSYVQYILTTIWQRASTSHLINNQLVSSPLPSNTNNVTNQSNAGNNATQSIGSSNNLLFDFYHQLSQRLYTLCVQAMDVSGGTQPVALCILACYSYVSEPIDTSSNNNSSSNPNSISQSISAAEEALQWIDKALLLHPQRSQTYFIQAFIAHHSIQRLKLSVNNHIPPSSQYPLTITSSQQRQLHDYFQQAIRAYFLAQHQSAHNPIPSLLGNLLPLRHTSSSSSQSSQSSQPTPTAMQVQAQTNSLITANQASTSGSLKLLPAFTGLIVLYLEHGRYRDAAMIAKEMVIVFPRHPRALYMLGIVMSKSAQGVPESLKAYAKALRLRPAFLEAAIPYLETLINLGRKEDVKECCQKILTSHPQSPRLWVLLAKVCTH
jgi:tetratricopeptide (TPR) repeat protein